MPPDPTKKQNLEVIKNRLQVKNLPTKFKDLSAKAIALFANHPELDSAVQVTIEQNDTIKSANGRRLVAENKLAEFLNPSKSEIVRLWHKLFGKVTKTDDEVLGEIGAVSKESVREDLDKTEQIVRDATDIAQQYRKKYGRQTDINGY